MKRNLITKKIISLILTVIMIGSCWVWMPIEASAEEVYTYSVDLPRSTDKSYYEHTGTGTLPGKLVNGKEFEVNHKYDNYSGIRGKNYRLYEFHFLDAEYKQMAYCIEPGVDVNKRKQFSEKDEIEACETLAKDATNAKTSPVLTTEEFRTLMRKVLGYGYQHGKSIELPNSIGYNMQNWTDVDGNETQKKCFCYALATQILVWELVVGERDAQFNLVPPSENGYISVYDRTIIHDHEDFEDNALKKCIDEYYNQIVKNVQAATPKNDENLAGHTFKLEPDETTNTMKVSIPDPNGLLKDVTSIDALDGETVAHDGSALNISVPYRYAKEDTYTIEYSIKYKEPVDIRYMTSSETQDLLSSSGGFVETNETFSIKIEIPHHHEWIPHYVIPTCTTEGLTCMMCKCGDIYTQKVEPCLGHNEKSPWVIGYPATCTEPGEEVQICNRCSTVINTRVIPATGHDEGVWIIETEATANHDGQMVLHCTKCGNRTQTDTFPRHEHNGQHTAVVNTATCATEGQLGTFCDTCGVCYKTTTIPAGHSKTQTWVTTLQPTCSRAGESSAYCKDCGDIVATKSLEATGHSDGVWMTSISPYCGLTGEDICICDKCGEIVASRETEALSHDEGVWKITKDPTCEFNGERVKSCTRCGQVIETEAIAALGHDEGVWKIDIEATADIDGSMGRYCTRCSMVLETKGFTLHSHEAGYTITLLQTTCTRDGEKGTVCKICNAVYSAENVPALNHDYSDFYTEDNGTHSKSCSRCHYVYTENCAYEVIESLEATCTTAGYKTSKCTVCAYTYSDSYVAPYGHTLGKWTSEGKSTHMRYCSDCGVMEITKHVWGEYFSNNDGDIIEEGSKTRSCIYCSESQTVGKPASIIESTYKATIEALDFLTRLFNILGEIRDYFIQILEFMKSTK